MMPLWVALSIVAACAVAFVLLRREPKRKPAPRAPLVRWRISELFDDKPKACPEGYSIMGGCVDRGPWQLPAEPSPRGRREAEGERRNVPRENAQICNLSWFDAIIPLGDTDFSHCQFIRCKLLDDGGPFSMKDCFLDHCTIQSANVQDEEPANERRGGAPVQRSETGHSETAIDKFPARGLEFSLNTAPPPRPK